MPSASATAISSPAVAPAGSTACTVRISALGEFFGESGGFIAEPKSAR